VDNRLRDIARVSLICFADERTQDIIQNYDSYSYNRQLESAAYLQNLMLSMITIRNDISGVYIFNKRSLIYKYDWGTGLRAGSSLTDSAWRPADGDSIWEYISGCKLTVGGLPDFIRLSSSAPARGEHHLYMAREVKSFSPHKGIGYILLLSPMLDLRQTIEQHLTDDSFYIVVDRQGTIICETYGRYTGQMFADIYPDIDLEGWVGESGLKSCDIDDVRYMADTMVSDYSGLTLLIGRPAAAVFGGTWRLLVLIIIISAGAVLCSVFFTLLQTRHVLKPIKMLSKTMENIGRDIHVTLPVTTEDESGRLIASFNHMMDTINKLISLEYETTIRLQEVQLQQREMQLLYLRSQINPHFLYNTLDTIRMKAALEGNSQVAEMIMMMVDFFRLSVGNNELTVPLKREAKLIQVYMQLMKCRHPGLNDFYDIDHSLDEMQIPSLILQPLVENSIMHGLKSIGYKGNIILRVYRDAENPVDILIEVTDNGVGLSSERLEQMNHALERRKPPPGIDDREHSHIGLVNVASRLQALYPGGFELRFYPNCGGGLVAKIRIDGAVGATEQEDNIGTVD